MGKMFQSRHSDLDLGFDFPHPVASSSPQYTSVDLFSGAGGLTRGLHMGGFESVAAVEHDKHAAKTYSHNFPDSDVYCDDIRNIDANEILEKSSIKAGELDLLAGGPPCQGFSVNAPVRSLDDPRNHLFLDFLRFAEVFKPKTILIENVPGIVTLEQGSVVKAIYHHLAKMGYKTTHRILYAGHYGVPQTRFRTIFLATRIGTESIRHPFPTHNSTARANFGGAKQLCFHINPPLNDKLSAQTTVCDAISDLPEIDQNSRVEEFPYRSLVSSYQKHAREGSNHVKNHYSSKIGNANKDRLRHIPQGGSWRDIPFELLPAGLKRARRSDHTKRYGRLHPNGLASTILTKCDPHWGTFFHPMQDRIISVREAARLQSFPDSFHFLGSITEQYRQVGNAVPPLLAHAISQTIVEHLKVNYG